MESRASPEVRLPGSSQMADLSREHHALLVRLKKTIKVIPGDIDDRIVGRMKKGLKAPVFEFNTSPRFDQAATAVFGSRTPLA